VFLLEDFYTSIQSLKCFEAPLIFKVIIFIFIISFSAFMDFSNLRNYLGGPIRMTPRDVMMDAVVFRVPGAVLLLRLILEMRVNRKSKYLLRCNEISIQF
jgi:hypothetical protein